MYIIKTLFVIIAPWIFLSGTMSQTNRSYTISGLVSGYTNGKIYLSYGEGKTIRKDSSIVKNGAFSFKGSIKEPMLAYLKIAGARQGQTSFFLQPGHIIIKGHKDSFQMAVVTGSETQDAWMEWNSSWKSITSDALLLYGQFDSATRHGTIPAATSDKKHFENGLEVLRLQMNNDVGAFIKKYPQSAVSAYIILDRLVKGHDTALVKRSFAMLGPGAKNSVYGKMIPAY